MNTILFGAICLFAGVILAVAVPKVYAWGAKVFGKAKEKVEDFRE